MIALTGLSAFPITPADPAGRVDTAGLARLLAPLVAAGVDSIGLLGSTGTYAYLTRAERRRALDAALDAVGGRVPVVVGVGALRTDEAVRLAQDAKTAGAGAGLLAPVSYAPLTADEVFAHFATVARESGLPLCIYDNPSTTHFAFTPELVGRLSRLPGVVAVKSPAPEAAAMPGHLAALRASVREEDFSLGYSVDWHATEALIAGGAAWYSVAGGLFSQTCLRIVRAVQAGNLDEARRVDALLRPLFALFKAHSSLRVCYAIAGMRGLTQALPPRPLLPIPESAQAQLAAVLGETELA